MASPTIDEIRAGIMAKIAAATMLPEQVLHAFERFAKEQSKFREFYVTGPAEDQRVHGYHVRRIKTREAMTGLNRWVIEHTWRVRGFMGIEDADASEKLFDIEIEAIRTAFRVDPVIAGAGSDGAECVTDSQESGVQLIDSGPVMFAGVLCHRADMSLTSRHYE